MDGSWKEERMPRLPRPGEWVRWRSLEHARTQWWDESHGPGPFEVVRVVDHTADDVPTASFSRRRWGSAKSTRSGLSWQTPNRQPSRPRIQNIREGYLICHALERKSSSASLTCFLALVLALVPYWLQ
jgi:hypothetical protein